MDLAHLLFIIYDITHLTSCSFSFLLDMQSAGFSHRRGCQQANVCILHNTCYCDFPKHTAVIQAVYLRCAMRSKAGCLMKLKNTAWGRNI